MARGLLGFGAVCVLPVVALLWSIPPALAACTPSGNIITCVDNTAGPIGGGADDRTVNVLSGASVTVGDDLIAIDLGDRSSVTNNGIITSGDAVSAESIGIQVWDDNNVIVNNGTVQVGSGQPSGPSAIAIATGSDNNQITNNGQILGGDYSIGIIVCCDNFITNAVSGTIKLGDGSIGIDAFGGNEITNLGAIVVGNTIAADLAIGIAIDSDNLVDNRGSITVGDADGFVPSMGISATGHENVILNSGSVRGGTNSIGIAIFGDDNSVTNAASGVIQVGAAGSGIMTFTGSTGTMIENRGRIFAGAGGAGIRLEGDGELTNFGVIGSTVDGFSIFSCDCVNAVVDNRGVLDGLIDMRGPTDFTNRGWIGVTDPASLTPIAPFTFIISDIGAGTATFTQEAEGTLSLRVAPGAPAPIDSLLGDTLTLAGTLRVAIQPGLYADTTVTDTAVSVTGNGPGGFTITSTFDRFTSSSPFFTVTPLFNGGAASPDDYEFLTLQLDRIPFGSVPGLNPNQHAVGKALEGGYSPALTGDAATLYGNLLAATSVAALDSISGEGTGATQNAAFGAGSLFNNAMQGQSLFVPNGGAINGDSSLSYASADRLRGHEAFAALESLARRGAGEASRWRVWMAGFGARRAFDGEGSAGSSGQTLRSYGGVVGVEHRPSRDLTYGFAAGGSDSSFSVGSLSTSGSVTGGHLGAYAVKTWGAHYAAASLSYAHFENDTRRTITGVGPTETATGRFGSDQIGARIELGHRHAFGSSAVTPFAAIEPAVLWQQGYTEISTTAGGGAGVLGLTVASRTATSLPTFVGVQVDGRYVLSGGARLAPYARASWVHEFLPDRRVTAHFISVPTATFTVDGARPARDAARLEAGAKLELRPGRTLFANVSGEISGRTESLSASGGYRASW